MDPRKLFSDSRHSGCAYCGDAGTTVDHVPSKVLLDEPYPPDIPTVPACEPCNVGFSSDEQYVGCFLECVIAGSPHPKNLQRPKIQRILSENPALAAMIAASRSVGVDQQLIWQPEHARVRNVVLKLARGHAVHEFSAKQIDEPEYVGICPLVLLNEAQRESFERIESMDAMAGWPEIGSRAFISAVMGRPCSGLGRWRTIQEGRYRYTVPDEGSVKLVIGEYLACEVRFS